MAARFRFVSLSQGVHASKKVEIVVRDRLDIPHFYILGSVLENPLVRLTNLIKQAVFIS